MADLEDAQADKFTGGFITGLKKGAAALEMVLVQGIIDGIKGSQKDSGLVALLHLRA